MTAIGFAPAMAQSAHGLHAPKNTKASAHVALLETSAKGVTAFHLEFSDFVPVDNHVPMVQPAPEVILRYAPRRIPFDEIILSPERTDTVFARRHKDKARDLEKVYPGYPRPALVSIDFRINF